MGDLLYASSSWGYYAENDDKPTPSMEAAEEAMKKLGKPKLEKNSFKLSYNNNNVSVIAHSFDDYIEGVKAMGDKHSRSGKNDSAKEDKDFSGVSSVEAAFKLLGSQRDSLVSFDEDDAILYGEAPGSQVYYDTTGDYLDVARHLSGEPEVFGNFTHGRGLREYIEINVMAGYHSSVYYEDILRNNRRLMRLVDWLEHNGVRCQINIAYISKKLAGGDMFGGGGKGWNHIHFTVKDYQDQLDMGILAAAAHPASFRRLGFIVKESVKNLSYGYGQSAYIEDRVVPESKAVQFNLAHLDEDLYEKLKQDLMKSMGVQE